jgi:hypothetical protein
MEVVTMTTSITYTWLPSAYCVRSSFLLCVFNHSYMEYFQYMSVQFSVVVVLWDSLVCQYMCEMWSCCRIHWYISTLLGCDHTVCFTDMSVHIWGVILLWDSLICQYTCGMWSYFRFHWYITTLLECDSTVWLICQYTNVILHSITSQKTPISIVATMGTSSLTYLEEILVYDDFEEDKLFLKNNVWKLWCDCDLIFSYILNKTAEMCWIKHYYSVYNEHFITLWLTGSMLQFLTGFSVELALKLTCKYMMFTEEKYWHCLNMPHAYYASVDLCIVVSFMQLGTIWLSYLQSCGDC